MNIGDLKRQLRYDPNEGHLYWIEPRKGRQRHRPAGTVTSSGYIGVMVGPKRYYAHRLCWAIAHGSWPIDQIDHVNGNKADNRLANLREASNAQNGKNLKLSSANTSGVTGVVFCKETGRWRSIIKVDGKTIHLGRWPTIEQATKARREAEAVHFGQWARGG